MSRKSWFTHARNHMLSVHAGKCGRHLMLRVRPLSHIKYPHPKHCSHKSGANARPQRSYISLWCAHCELLFFSVAIRWTLRQSWVSKQVPVVKNICIIMSSVQILLLTYNIIAKLCMSDIFPGSGMNSGDNMTMGISGDDMTEVTDTTDVMGTDMTGATDNTTMMVCLTATSLLVQSLSSKINVCFSLFQMMNSTLSSDGKNHYILVYTTRHTSLILHTLWIHVHCKN